MDNIFGIPMSSIVLALVILLALCLLTVAWVAWRRPVIFKMGMRNIPRRRAQTILIVVGLMLSTLIIAAALGTGDTLNYSMTASTYDTLGHMDEMVAPSTTVKIDNFNSTQTERMNAQQVATVSKIVTDDPNVAGTMPVLYARMSVLNPETKLSEPMIAVSGLDPNGVGAFGGVKDTHGTTVEFATMPDKSVVISQKLADKLNAHKGDKLTFYYDNQPIALTVEAIAPNTVMSGASDNFNEPSASLPLPVLQQLTGQPELVSAVMIANKGGVRGGLDHWQSVTNNLEQGLAGTGLGVQPVKHDIIKSSETLSSIFTGLFLVLGLFSIAAGVLLIVLIFTMLAAERRPEMGMTRAVGAQRGQLIQQFVSEGSGYALLAGLVGAGLGVGAAVLIGFVMRWLVGDFLPITPHVTLRSMIGAYCLGVVITFIAVVGSSWKISRLNVVAAVRDIPDTMNFRRRKWVLVCGGLLLIVGALMILPGLSNNSATLFYTGMSLAPFGLVLMLRFFGIRHRIVLSIVGLYIVILWLLPSNVADKLFGKLDGGMELFFLSGIFMVIGATIVIVQNLDVLLAGVERFGSLFQSKLPAVRTAISYPGAAKFRTGMAIAMFSLIVFSLVMVATMNDNYTRVFISNDANAGWDIQADAPNATGVPNITQTLKADGVDTANFRAVGAVTSVAGYGNSSDVRLAGTQDWKQFPVKGMDSGFINGSKLKFQGIATGYNSEADVIKALETQPNVAIVDSSVLGGNGGFGPDSGFVLTGTKIKDKTFAPVKLELSTPTGPKTVTIIGILDNKISTMVGLYANEQTVASDYAVNGTPKLGTVSYFIGLKDASHSSDVAKQVEAALFSYGIHATSIKDALRDAQKMSSGFLYLIEGFMALGLIVGVAAVGVISFRSVVERRQQIGMLRAIGYQKSMVALSFLIETAFVVGIGVIAGTVLAVILARDLFTSDTVSAGTGFTVPWLLIALILGATVIVALLMAWIPSRQASSLVPAEALRYE